MRAVVCRQLRRIAYEGRGHHPGPVKYFKHLKHPEVCIADQQRQKYQRLKGLYLERLFIL